MFGLTQFEIASFLDVKRSHWSHFVRKVKNLPTNASLLLSQMTLYMLSEEAKAAENLPSTKQGRSRATEVLLKMHKEIEFQLLVISRKISKEQQLKDRFLKAVQTTDFLSKKAVKDATAPHQLLKSTAEGAEINLQNAVFRLNCLLAQEQLLKVQFDWLKKNVGEL